jgi:hypothetical protein
MKLADYIINGDYLNASPVRPKMVGDSITYKLPWGAIIEAVYVDSWVSTVSMPTVFHVFSYEDSTNNISIEKKYYIGDLYGNFESGWMQICRLSKEASEKFRIFTDDNQGNQ